MNGDLTRKEGPVCNVPPCGNAWRAAAGSHRLRRVHSRPSTPPQWVGFSLPAKL